MLYLDGLRLPLTKQFFAFLTLGAAILLSNGFASQTATPPNSLVFPSVSAYSLDKERANLPQDFAGKTNLLLISFETEQQKQIETWLPTALAIQHSNFDFRFYRLPVSNRENFVFRWWELSSMRSDETDPETWHWIVPLYIDKQAFRRALQIPDERQIVLLLADKQGRILWRTTGPMTPEKRATLFAAVPAH